jgi:thioredoxin reductase (NADPH)
MQMSWVVPLALISLAIAIIVVFTMLSAKKKHRASVAPAVTVGPAVLVHDINDDRCTGCDACVAVCPTNVLDLVNNKSRVLRFEDCIQCEACMVACPTEALVMFPEGTLPPPLQVPEMDENFQTAIPGQYLIGEVAGKPLVKNAANLGRMVVEHMLQTGIRSGALGRGTTELVHVDVAIVGSGPAGLSAALSCIQRGLSYVVLDKEQMIASTISRYPKGKLVMAEPYDSVNLSLLPVFDSSKEQLIPIWRELLDRVGMKIQTGESVESVQLSQDQTFAVRTTVSAYRAQRVVLAIGTRGKPRTLQVPGENLPKIYSLLEDPDEWRGKAVLVVGGGDSAVEAALALADAGAMVTISYRGKGFARAAPKNKQAIEAYAAEGRLKAKMQSQVLAFDAESVTMAMADGAQKKYSNAAAFVLIGADPPVAWLEKLGVRFVEREHQYQLGKSDDVVRRFVPRAVECPQDAARAAAQVMGGNIGAVAAGADLGRAIAAAQAGQAGTGSGPRKWLRSATSIFSNRPRTEGPDMGPPPKTEGKIKRPEAKKPDIKEARDGRKLDGPVPLSEFARQQRTGNNQNSGHTGHGRRDALSAGERTRILRMLRDEGGRLADEDSSDSSVYIGAAPAPAHISFDLDLDDSPAPAPLRNAPAPSPRVMAGATSRGGGIRSKPNDATKMISLSPAASPAKAGPVAVDEATVLGSRQSLGYERDLGVKNPAPPKSAVAARSDKTTRPPPPGVAAPLTLSATKPATSESKSAGPRRPVPPPFSEEPTRQADSAMVASLRDVDRGGKRIPAAPDEATRMADIEAMKKGRFEPEPFGDAPATSYDPLAAMRNFAAQQDDYDADAEERTSIADASVLARGAQRGVNQRPAPPIPAGSEERTRIGESPKPSGPSATGGRNMSNVDWDIE